MANHVLKREKDLYMLLSQFKDNAYLESASTLWDGIKPIESEHH